MVNLKRSTLLILCVVLFQAQFIQSSLLDASMFETVMKFKNMESFRHFAKSLIMKGVSQLFEMVAHARY